MQASDPHRIRELAEQYRRDAEISLSGMFAFETSWGDVEPALLTAIAEAEMRSRIPGIRLSTELMILHRLRAEYARRSRLRFTAG